MTMYTNITTSEAVDIFKARGRLDVGDGKGGNFTPAGVEALVEYMEQLEDDLGESIQFDAIGLCCQFSEYESAMEAVQDRDPNLSEQFHVNNDSDGEAERDALEWLQDETIVIEFNGGIIIDSEF